MLSTRDVLEGCMSENVVAHEEHVAIDIVILEKHPYENTGVSN